MSEETTHYALGVQTPEYEAKLWENVDGWHAKVLHNGVYFDSRNGFPDRYEALVWAKETVEREREAVVAERKAERVEL